MKGSDRSAHRSPPRSHTRTHLLGIGIKCKGVSLLQVSVSVDRQPTCAYAWPPQRSEILRPSVCLSIGLYRCPPPQQSGYRARRKIAHLISLCGDRQLVHVLYRALSSLCLVAGSTSVTSEDCRAWDLLDLCYQTLALHCGLETC
jgi:hypothetical protein